MPKTTKNKSMHGFSRQTAKARRKSLINAAIRCLSRGGIAEFTIDRISLEAGVSRGLINHHFKGIGGLLAAVYDVMTAWMRSGGQAALAVEGGTEKRLATVIGVMFAAPVFSKSSLRAWLALWGEVAVKPDLKAAHRKSYAGYRDAMARVIGEIAEARGTWVDGGELATVCIAIIDGLWIEWCIDSRMVSREMAQEAVYGVLEARLGPLQR